MAGAGGLPVRAALVVLLVGAGPAAAQTVRLVETSTGLDRVHVRLGDTLSVDVVADLGTLQGSAVSAFVSFPAAPFRVVDAAPADGTQPFTLGPLFEGATVVANLLVPPGDVPDVFAGRRLLDFAASLRSGGARSGTGVVATFRVRCVQAVEEVRMQVDVNPVRESLVALADGGEQLFRVSAPLIVSVGGIELLDIPDVSLLPGQVDTVRIGRLDKYVTGNFALVDSIRWTASGTDPQTVQVAIDRRRRARVTHHPAFRGRRTVTFTAAEPRPIVTGEPVPTASETAQITVNTPARFAARRDTVRILEDTFTYIVSSRQEPDPARAHRGRDLDLIVDDPEVPESLRHSAFQYATATYRPGTDTLRQVRARVDPVTHELLVWSLPNFSGVDSFRVHVADEFTVARTGGDVLVVVVVVEEVPDRPRFLLDEVIRLPVSTQRAIALSDYVFDRDTPVRDLRLTWIPDVGNNFTVLRDGDSLRFGAPPFAVQGLILFTVTDPDSLTDRLSQRITATAPPLPPDSVIVPGQPDFRLRPLPDLSVEVGQLLDALALDDHLDLDAGLSAGQITWSLFTVDEDANALASVRADRRLRLRGLAVGGDTLVVRARGPRGRVREDTTLVTVAAATSSDRVLALRPIPDVDFVAGHAFVAFDLDDFVVDRVAHPDSVLEWSSRFLGNASIIVQLRADRTVFVTAASAAEARVVFTAENLIRQLSGRDTVRIAAAPATSARLPLAFPEVSLAPGAATEVDLDAHLPAAVPAVDTTWSVSGQRLTQAAVLPSHRLRVTAPLDRVGTDTLSVRVDLGRGFGARGPMRVRIVEDVPAGDFRLLLVPNPAGTDNVTVYAVARRATASAPVVTLTAPGLTANVAVGALITDLQRRGVLVWSGVTRLPFAFAGTVTLRASVASQRGTQLTASAALLYARARAGRALVLQAPEARLELPADAVAAGRVVSLAVTGPDASPWDEPDRPEPGELALRHVLELHPAGLALQRPGKLWAEAGNGARAGLFRPAHGGAWTFLAPLPGRARVDTLGRHAVLLDTVPPALTSPVQVVPGRFRAAAEDGGSGIDAATLAVISGGRPLPVCSESRWIDFALPADQLGAPRSVTLTAADRLGNVTRRDFVLAVPALPSAPQLGAAYPNPFNPAARIPFALPAGPPVAARLDVYNIAGQRVRQLLDTVLDPGYHIVTWDGADDRGRPVASGVYVARLSLVSGALTTRLALLR